MACSGVPQLAQAVSKRVAGGVKADGALSAWNVVIYCAWKTNHGNPMLCDFQGTTVATFATYHDQPIDPAPL